MSVRISTGKQRGVSWGGAGVGVVVVAVSEVRTAVEEKAKTGVAELIAVTLEIIAAKLVDHNDHDQLGASVVGRGKGGSGEDRNSDQGSGDEPGQRQKKTQTDRSGEGSHREGSLHRRGEYAKGGMKLRRISGCRQRGKTVELRSTGQSSAAVPPQALLFGRFQEELDLEDAGPQLPGDKQTLVVWGVGDSVENSPGLEVVDRGQKTGEVDPADHLAALRRDAGDAIRLPNVGKNFSLDEFELVQLVDRLVSVVDFNATLFCERIAVQNAELSGSVAHEKVTAIGGESPAFAGVCEGAP